MGKKPAGKGTLSSELHDLLLDRKKSVSVRAIRASMAATAGRTGRTEYEVWLAEEELLGKRIHEHLIGWPRNAVTRWVLAIVWFALCVGLSAAGIFHVIEVSSAATLPALIAASLVLGLFALVVGGLVLFPDRAIVLRRLAGTAIVGAFALWASAFVTVVVEFRGTSRGLDLVLAAGVMLGIYFLVPWGVARIFEAIIVGRRQLLEERRLLLFAARPAE